VRYTGYVDWALDCSTGVFSNAWMLQHSCDSIDHAPGFPRAGAFHPARTFTFVGPSVGFLIGALQPIEVGSFFLEDVRRKILPVPGTTGEYCEYEERAQGSLDPLFELCQCGLPTGPQQYSVASLFVAGGCGTVVTSPGGPFLPGFVSMGIGRWTDPTTYPGEETLRWNTGGYDYDDPCTGITRQEVFFGVTTIDGFPARQLTVVGPGAALPPTFVDQANSLRKNTSSTIMNVPYVSDHILNLNF
jgi:hypothetical protein